MYSFQDYRPTRQDDAWADAVEDLPKHATTLTFLKEIADMPPEPGELIWKHENEGNLFLLRYWASVLLIDAHRAIKAGDEDQYIENIIDMIRIAEHIDDNIPRYNYFFGFSTLYREAISDVSRRMINHELSSTALVTFAGIKNERNPSSYFAAFTKVERNGLYLIDPWLSGADFWNSLEINKLKTQRGVLNRSKVVLSKFHESPHIFLANLYGSEVRSAHESVPIFSRRLARIRFPAKIFSFQLDLVTERELNRVKFAVGAFVLDHATFPESLDELVPDYLDTVPIDAFDGKAVKVYRDDNEFRVYSVGTDRADNAGKSYLEMRRDNSDGTSGFDNVVKIPISTPSNVAGV